MTNFYDLSFNDTFGKQIKLSEFAGKPILIVNTATKCGFAWQFEELEKLHQDFKDQGLIVIGFPCDQFAGQEPETNDSMVNVCKLNFGVTFTLSEKINVNGKDTHPIFDYLKNNADAGILKRIKWNFTKFLISPDGKKIERYAPNVAPETLRPKIEEYLKIK